MNPLIEAFKARLHGDWADEITAILEDFEYRLQKMERSPSQDQDSTKEV